MDWTIAKKISDRVLNPKTAQIGQSKSEKMDTKAYTPTKNDFKQESASNEKKSTLGLLTQKLKERALTTTRLFCTSANLLAAILPSTFHSYFLEVRFAVLFAPRLALVLAGAA
jgi:hypothetical protein